MMFLFYRALMWHLQRRKPLQVLMILISWSYVAERPIIVFEFVCTFVWTCRRNGVKLDYQMAVALWHSCSFSKGLRGPKVNAALSTNFLHFDRFCSGYDLHPMGLINGIRPIGTNRFVDIFCSALHIRGCLQLCNLSEIVFHVDPVWLGLEVSKFDIE